MLFSPEDLTLVKGDPSDRRRFLDDLLVLRTPRLAGTRADYDRVLKQRNSLLKTAGAAPAGSRPQDAALATLVVWDEQLARHGAELLEARLALVDDLRPYVGKAYETVARGASRDDAEIEYRRRCPVEPGRLEAAILAELERRRKDELDRGISLVGPHRDELLLWLGHGAGRHRRRRLPVKGYASHGESWSFALALRLASYDLLRSDGDDPILILDDVFAELDTERRAQLADLVAGAEQVLVTAAVPEDVPAALAGVAVRRRRRGGDPRCLRRARRGPSRRTRTTASTWPGQLTRATAGSRPRRPASAGPGATTGRATPRSPAPTPTTATPSCSATQVDRLVADRGWELELRVRGVFARWPELVGAEVGAHCTPEAFADGQLVVRTDSTAWATQLTLLAPTVVRRLNEELGHGTVTVIDVLGPAPARRGPRAGAGPATAAVRATPTADGRRRRADLRAARPYGDLSDPLRGRSRRPPRAAASRFSRHVAPRSWRRCVECGLLTGSMDIGSSRTARTARSMSHDGGRQATKGTVSPPT